MAIHVGVYRSESFTLPDCSVPIRHSRIQNCISFISWPLAISSAPRQSPSSVIEGLEFQHPGYGRAQASLTHYVPRPFIVRRKKHRHPIPYLHLRGRLTLLSVDVLTVTHVTSMREAAPLSSFGDFQGPFLTQNADLYFIFPTFVLWKHEYVRL